MSIDTSSYSKLIDNNKYLNANTQPDVLGIIQNENKRIEEKKQAVDNMKFEQQRIIQLNRNLQERTAAFNQILIIIFISLAIMVVIIFIGRFFPGFEPFVILSCVIVLGAGVCYSIYLYLLFTQRQVNDYDLINTTSFSKPPQSTDTSKPLDNAYDFNDLMNFTCTGDACCSGNGVIWNGNACVSGGTFATLTDAYGYSDYISSQTEPVSVNYPVNPLPVQPSAKSCQNPIAYPSQYPKA